MRLRNTAQAYGAVPQVLHWAIVALVLLSWISGQFGDELPRGAARIAGLFTHMSAGLAIMILAIIRLAWRVGDPPPPPEQTFLGEWGNRASRWVHFALYALMFIVPLAGIAVQFARGDALPVFGLFEIASPWQPDRALARSLKEVHEVLANGLALLAALHALAALAHHFVLRDRTLLRMLPGQKR